MKISALTCPKCGASLSPPHDERTVRCSYCGTSVVVEADGGAPHAGAPAVGNGKPAALALVALGGLAAVLGIVALVVLTRGRAQSPAPTPPPEPTTATTPVTPAADVSGSVTAPEAPRAAPPPVPTASAAPTAEPNALADVTLEFGEEGHGPGHLDDARAIAVDPSGDIYVAEYGSRRIQRFDASGKFVAGFQVEPGKHGSAIPSIAATSDGHLWVSRMGELVELSLPDGKVVKTVPSQEPRVAYTGIALDATDAVYAGNEGATTWVGIGGQGPPRSDALRKLDKNGRLLAGWKGMTSGSGLGDRVAVDREGNVYLAERLRCIDVIDAHGKLKTRIDAHGDGGIAVDAKGRIFLGSGWSVSVYDATGTKLGQIKTGGEVDNLTMGRDGRLYTVSRTRVRVLTLR